MDILERSYVLIISESFRVKRLLLIIISCLVEVGQLMGCLYCFKNIRTVRINSHTVLILCSERYGAPMANELWIGKSLVSFWLGSLGGVLGESTLLLQWLESGVTSSCLYFYSG